jgi:hypothetical protein
MLSKQIKKTKTDASKQRLNDFNNYMIKIDYFDKKGTKNFENNIPLTLIFNPVVELHK